MIKFTEQARERVLAFLADEEDELAVRIEILDSSPLAPRYDLSLVEPDERDGSDLAIDQDGFEVLVRPDSADLLKGATIEWVESLQGSGFKVENPNIQPIGAAEAKGPLADRVRHVIEYQINPSIASHGGQVNLVDVRENVVYIQMSGGCQGCGMAAVTLSQGIHRILTETLPEIEDIVDVTNHDAGVNPYYQS